MKNVSLFPASRRTFMDVLGGLVLAAALPVGAFGQSLSSTKIATIGAGHEGGSIGTLFAKLGHPVMFSSQHPEQLKDLVAAAGPTARAGTVAEAVAFGDVVFLVVPYSAVPQIGRDFGSALATKSLVVDVSNPSAERDGKDLMAQITAAGGVGLYAANVLKGAHIVRAFNALHTPSLAAIANRPADQGGLVGVPIAGNDPKAIDLASRLTREIGFEPVLVGDLAKAKYLVPGSPISGLHTAAELRQIAATLT
jgi:8-hydroxy-5-deazaflavin:NADPH oxidoreductase